MSKASDCFFSSHVRARKFLVNIDPESSSAAAANGDGDGKDGGLQRTTLTDNDATDDESVKRRSELEDIVEACGNDNIRNSALTRIVNNRCVRSESRDMTDIDISHNRDHTQWCSDACFRYLGPALTG